MHSHTVLFVDDEPNILKTLQRILRNERMNVLTASSAEEALNILGHTEAQVVLSDQDMPEMSGVELLARVRDHHPATVRMMLTGYTAMNVAVEAINRGEIDYNALIAGQPQEVVANSEGAFRLYRAGDAVSSRNVHAAIYDSLRLCKDF